MGLTITLSKVMKTNVFDHSITHNLTEMAKAAGIYDLIWRPEENNIEKANQLIIPLIRAREQLLCNPEYFKKFEHKSGFGTYRDFIDFIKLYLDACKEHPDASISTWK